MAATRGGQGFGLRTGHYREIECRIKGLRERAAVRAEGQSR